MVAVNSPRSHHGSTADLDGQVKRGDRIMSPRVGERCIRFTPTCVGTTASLRVRLQSIGSPPRAWGHTTRPACACCAIAVHPHVRGDHEDSARQFSDCSRFTPTCVGTTCQPFRAAQMSTVHPHVRGDNARAVPDTQARVRFTPTCVGTTPMCAFCDLSALRFTPTCVGTTCTARAVAGVLAWFTPTCVGTTW